MSDHHLIQPKRFALTILAVLLFAGSLGAVAYGLVTLRDQTQRNKTALVSLCLLRQDLDRRIVSQGKSITQAFLFLKKNPHGAFGFTPTQIRSNIRDQQRAQTNSRRTRAALRVLECKESK